MRKIIVCLLTILLLFVSFVNCGGGDKCKLTVKDIKIADKLMNGEEVEGFDTEEEKSEFIQSYNSKLRECSDEDLEKLYRGN